jgi:hypothetical protein
MLQYGAASSSRAASVAPESQPAIPASSSTAASDRGKAVLGPQDNEGLAVIERTWHKAVMELRCWGLSALLK